MGEKSNLGKEFGIKEDLKTLNPLPWEPITDTLISLNKVN